MLNSLDVPLKSPGPVDPALITGTAAIARLVYADADLDGLRGGLIERLTADPMDAAAWLDASLVLLLTGQRDEGLRMQADALSLRRHYHVRLGAGDGLRILALVTPGDLMANTPIDFLLEGSGADLHYLYVDADTQDLADAPDHDVAFMAVGESEANRPVLDNLARLMRGWPKPVVNGATDRVAGLARDTASALLAGDPSILAPVNQRVTRKDLESLAAGGAVAGADSRPFPPYPMIVRPVGLHAGDGLARLDGPADIVPYLGERRGSAFYVAPYVDYAGPDGLFRKQRIVFIDGRAYPSHQATSAHWIVHYLSAGMTEDAARRQEEADWMATFDTSFAVRHADAFAALHQRLGLDYFGIDSAETDDGRLLVFEVDTAMIVHAMDPVEVFPYKKPAMRRLFAAFLAMLEDRVAAHRRLRVVAG